MTTSLTLVLPLRVWLCKLLPWPLAGCRGLNSRDPWQQVLSLWPPECESAVVTLAQGFRLGSSSPSRSNMLRKPLPECQVCHVTSASKIDSVLTKRPAFQCCMFLVRENNMNIVTKWKHAVVGFKMRLSRWKHWLFKHWPILSQKRTLRQTHCFKIVRFAGGIKIIFVVLMDRNGLYSKTAHSAGL